MLRGKVRAQQRCLILLIDRCATNTTIANLGKIAALQSDIAPATKAISEITKQFESYKISIPSAVTELQQKLSEIKLEILVDSSDNQQDDEEENANGQNA